MLEGKYDDVFEIEIHHQELNITIKIELTRSLVSTPMLTPAKSPVTELAFIFLLGSE